jgi:hypothetical protein
MQSNLVLTNYYRFECFRKGKLLWEETIKNIIVTVGLNDILDKYFKGSSYTAAWYVGLVDNAGWTAFAAGDTLASHSGWTEFTTYSGTRKALTLGTVSAGSVDNSASKASFTITTGGTLKGAFVATVTSGTSGTLYGEGAFTATRTVAIDDVLNVTITLTSASG